MERLYLHPISWLTGKYKAYIRPSNRANETGELNAYDFRSRKMDDAEVAKSEAETEREECEDVNL